MAKIVGAISMSHAPGATGWPEAVQPEMKQRLDDYHRSIADYLERAKPDVVIALLDDHFENMFRTLMPAFGIGIAPTHTGPAAHMVKALGHHRQEVIPSDPEFAEHLLHSLVSGGIDAARMGEVEYGNNLITPFKLIRPQFDLTVVPFFTNVFTPPLPPTWRAYQVGESLQQSIQAYRKDLRVVLLATGGLSHWPPVWTEDSPSEDSFLQRMRRFQTEGRAVLADDPNIYDDLAKYEIEMAAKNQWPLNSSHPLVNDEWDRRVMTAFAQGDVGYFKALTYDEVQRKGGHGGHELLNWLIVMGAVNGKPARVIGYEPVVEWICGMGYLVYDL